MKNKFLIVVFGVFMLLGLSACGNSNNVSSAPVVSNAQKTLVVYFSVPETTNAKNMNQEEENSTVVIDGKVLGNTQYVASLIQNKTNADIFRIEPVKAYPLEHTELEAVAVKEIKEGALPEISSKITNIEQYDVIFVGYPNWYRDMPRIMYTFFNEYDLKGKTIIPFVTSGGSGFSDSISTIEKLQPNAKVIEQGLSIIRDNAEGAEPKVSVWLNKLGYK